jgi:acetyl-CoA carboxylase alpha subunit
LSRAIAGEVATLRQAPNEQRYAERLNRYRRIGLS